MFVASRWGAIDAVRITPNHSNMHEAQLLQLNSSKANTQLNWSTRWSFHDTMHHTVDWYRGGSAGQSVEMLTKSNITDYLSLRP